MLNTCALCSTWQTFFSGRLACLMLTRIAVSWLVQVIRNIFWKQISWAHKHLSNSHHLWRFRDWLNLCFNILPNQPTTQWNFIFIWLPSDKWSECKVIYATSCVRKCILIMPIGVRYCPDTFQPPQSPCWGPCKQLSLQSLTIWTVPFLIFG